MEEEIIAFQNKMYDKIQKFDTRPLYILQVNKNNCRVLILCNDIPHWLTFFENYGETQAIYLNNYIPKSGQQNITVQIYPKEGQEFIVENADVDVKLKYAKDKDDGVNTYQILNHSELSEAIRSQKLNYYELKIPFMAQVPWDISKELEMAQDLTKMPNIEQKVIEKYQHIRELIIDGNGLAFLKEYGYSDLKSCSYLYANKSELLVADREDNQEIKITKLNVKNRIVNSIRDYEVIFAANGKLVQLRYKKDKRDLIGYSFEKEDGSIDGQEKPTLLYMPQGSNELKVW